MREHIKFEYIWKLCNIANKISIFRIDYVQFTAQIAILYCKIRWNM